jgi:large subunit ribosomal protein L40e
MTSELLFFYKGKQVVAEKLPRIQFVKEVSCDISERENSIDMEDEDIFIDNLNDALKSNNMKLYGKIVEENKRVWKDIDNDFWMETFSGRYYEGSLAHKEISFWVNYKGRSFTIQELSILDLNFNDLLLIALKRKDTDFSEADEVISNLKYDIEELEKAENGEIIEEPSDYSKLKGYNVYRVNKTGIKTFMMLGYSDDCPKVILLDKSMVKVDFTEQKKIIRKRITLIEKYAVKVHPDASGGVHPGVPSGTPTQDYDSLNYNEIKAVCSDKGLSSKGKKDDLIAQLVEYDKKKREEAAHFKVFVKTLAGSCYTIYAEKDDTIYRVKQLIEENNGFPPEKQQLTIMGSYTMLENDKTLHDYDIRNEDFLSLTYRMS